MKARSCLSCRNGIMRGKTHLLSLLGDESGPLPPGEVATRIPPTKTKTPGLVSCRRRFGHATNGHCGPWNLGHNCSIRHALGRTVVGSATI